MFHQFAHVEPLDSVGEAGQGLTSSTPSKPTSPETSIWFNQELLVNDPKPKKGTPKETTGTIYLVYIVQLETLGRDLF